MTIPRNPKRSGGPQSSRWSPQNALQHGLTAQQPNNATEVQQAQPARAAVPTLAALAELDPFADLERLMPVTCAHLRKHAVQMATADLGFQLWAIVASAKPLEIKPLKDIEFERMIARREPKEQRKAMLADIHAVRALLGGIEAGPQGHGAHSAPGLARERLNRLNQKIISSNTKPILIKSAHFI